MSRSSFWRGLAAGALVAGAALFLGLTVARNRGELRAFDWSLDPLLLALSVLALTAVLGWGVVVWKLVLDRFPHPPVPLGTLLRIWFLSNLARYIPGKIWQFVGAAELARAAGISRPVLLTSMVVHVGFSLLSAAVVGALALALYGDVGVPLLPVAVLALGSGFLVHPAVLNGALRLVPRALHREVLRWNGGWARGLLLLGLSVFSWLIYGAAFTLFVAAVVPVGLDALLPLAGVNALSFLAGYLVFVAPAGLGPREGAMAVLLRPFAPAGVAAVVAVLSRLWTIAAELLGAGLVMLLPATLPLPRPGASIGENPEPTDPSAS